MTTTQQRERLARKLLAAPPIRWESMVEAAFTRNMEPGGMDALAHLLDDEAERCAFLAEYVRMRTGVYGSKRDHAKARKEAQRVQIKVSRALGYSYPKARVFLQSEGFIR